LPFGAVFLTCLLFLRLRTAPSGLNLASQNPPLSQESVVGYTYILGSVSCSIHNLLLVIISGAGDKKRRADKTHLK
jgi:hypothetical protein